MKLLMAASVRDSELTGVPRQMRALGQEFDRLGHQVDYVFLPATARWRPSTTSLRFSLWILPRLLGDARHGSYDAFILHSSDGWLYGLVRRMLPGLFRTPYVMASHGLEHRFWKVFLTAERAGQVTLTGRHKLVNRLVRLHLVRLAVHTCDRLICLSQAERAFVVSRGWKPEAEVALIYNGVGPEYFRRQAPLHAPLSRLVYLGPWTWNKGRHVLAQAFPQLAARYPELRISLLGTGATPPAVLADFPAELHHRIRIVQAIAPTELPVELAAHDLFIFPSLFEGGPLSLLEGMAAGLPVVAADCFVMSEIVRARIDGLLTLPGDPVAFAAAIDRLLQHPEEARQMGRAARQRAHGMSWTNSARLTLELLQSAVRPSNAPGSRVADARRGTP